MNKQDRNERFTLTVFFSLVVFCTLILTLLIAGLLAYFLTRWGVFIPDGQTELSYRAIIFLTMALSLIIGTALTLVVIRTAIKPINSLVEGMRQLASGNYKARISMGPILGSFSTGDKVLDTFNILASELENTEMLRSDFINNFSHEFKTPIVSIAGFAKLLKRGNLTENEKAEYLDVIEQEAMRLSYMATNVLNLTKVENQSILSGQTEYNLSEQLRTCVLLLESKWEKKGTQFELDFREYNVIANEELMKQVWLNLLDNAIKFCPEEGIVKIAIAEGADHLEISFANQGKEIPAENIAKIFNKFYQADESHSGEGNGIGLAIVKHIVQLHSGEITVSRDDGFNVFSVKLPKAVIADTI